MKISNYRVPTRWLTVPSSERPFREYIVLAESHDDARARLHAHLLVNFQLVNPSATVEEYVVIGQPHWIGDIANAATWERL